MSSEENKEYEDLASLLEAGFILTKKTISGESQELLDEAQDTADKLHTIGAAIISSGMEMAFQKVREGNATEANGLIQVVKLMTDVMDSRKNTLNSFIKQKKEEKN